MSDPQDSTSDPLTTPPASAIALPEILGAIREVVQAEVTGAFARLVPQQPMPQQPTPTPVPVSAGTCTCGLYVGHVCGGHHPLVSSIPVHPKASVIA